MVDQNQPGPRDARPASAHRSGGSDRRSPGAEIDFRMLLDAVEDAVFLYDVDHTGSALTFRFEWNNPAHDASTGMPLDEFEGRTLHELYGDRVGADLTAHYRRCVETRAVVEYDETLDHPAGTVDWHTTLTPVIEDGVVEKIVGVDRDVTERKRRERERQRLESLLSDMERSADIGAYDVDLETEEVWWTDGMRRVFGVDDSFEPTIENSIEFYHPDDRARIASGYAEQLESGNPDLVEARIVTGNGVERRVEAFGYALEIDGTRHLRGYVQDISDRTENEREIERNRDLLSKTEQLAAIGGWELDCRTDELRWTDGTRRIFGVSDGYEPTLEGAVEFYHPEDRARIRTLVEQCRARGERYNEVLRIETEHGNERLVRCLGQPVITDGEVAALRGAVLDVTDQNARENRFQQYKRAIEGATDLISACDRDGRYLFANPQYRRYHGIERDEVARLTLQDVFDEENRAETERHRDRALRGETVRYQTVRTHPTRGRRTLDVHYYPLGTGGEISGTVAILRDVTDRNERTKHLQVVDRVLRHNLRNDLNVIEGWAACISAEPGTQIAAAAEQIVESSGDLLATSDKARTITDILIEEPRVTAIEVDKLITRIAASCAERWTDTRLTVDVPGTTSFISSIHLSEAVGELVVNAFVHSDRESPAVEVHVGRTEDAVQLRVVDDGPGIPEMDRVILEEGRSPDDLSHGSGLGMWMVYWIVRRSGGELTVTDRDPRGSVVTMAFPTAAGSE